VSIILQRFIQVACTFLFKSLNSIPWDGWSTDYLIIHLLKDVFVSSNLLITIRICLCIFCVNISLYIFGKSTVLRILSKGYYHLVRGIGFIEKSIVFCLCFVYPSRIYC
jgi:hypothetical protein